MTDKGYVVSDPRDNCISDMFDENNNGTTPWKYIKAFADGNYKYDGTH